MSQEHYTFADIKWQSRWNSPTKPCVYLSQIGPDLLATGCMGTLRLNLDNDGDIDAAVTKLRRFAEAIADAKRRYDVVTENIEEFLKENNESSGSSTSDT